MGSLRARPPTQPIACRAMAVQLHAARVLLTGASGGIGNAIARALHARGATLVVSGRRVEQLEALRGELGEERVEPLPADLANPGEARALAERAGAVDVLVANAALPASGPIDGFSAEQIDRALDVNLRAPIQLTHALLPAMKQRGGGHLVYTSSMAGKIANPGSALYSATKYGLRGFSLCLHEDLLGSGIGVTTIFPGFVRDAGMWADTGLKTPQGIRTSSPEQVAAAVIRGIERNVAEIDVAPLEVRASARLAGLSPRLVAAVGRRGGARATSDEIAAAQRDKR